MEQTLSLAAAVHRFDAPLPVVAGLRRKQQKATKKAWKSAPRLFPEEESRKGSPPPAARRR